MLNILETSPSIGEHLIFDGYTPFQVVLGMQPEELLENPIYWRYSNGDDGLLEVGINGNTGEVATVTLVLLSHDVVSQINHGCAVSKPLLIGRPRCNISTLPGEQHARAIPSIEEVGPLSLTIDTNSACLSIGEYPIARVIAGERVRFCLTATGDLCRIDLLNLSDDEMTRMTSSLSR